MVSLPMTLTGHIATAIRSGSFGPPPIKTLKECEHRRPPGEQARKPASSGEQAPPRRRQASLPNFTVLAQPRRRWAAEGVRPSAGTSPTFRQQARCMHKRWIQAIFLCHQLRQIFLLFHSADFGQSTGEALGSALSDAGSRGSAWLPRRSASRGEGTSARPHRPAHRAPATPAVGLRGPAPTPARPFRRPSLAPSPPTPLTRAALTGEAGTGRVPPPPAIHWWRCRGRRGPRAGRGLSLGRAARRIA